MVMTLIIAVMIEGGWVGGCKVNCVALVHFKSKIKWPIKEE